MQRNDTSVFIEDMSTLKILSTDRQGYSIAQDEKTSQHYLLNDHLALPIDSHLINPQTGRFNDPLSGTAKRNQFDRIYDPFRPGNYTKYETHVLQETSSIPELRSAGWSFYFKKTPYSIDFRDADFYVIHNQFPWLGLNITKEFDLRLTSYGLFGTTFKSSNGGDCQHIVRDLLSRWNQAKENSSFPVKLQNLVRQRNKELEEKIRLEQQQQLEKQTGDSIIAEILRSSAYKNFAKYLVVLAGDRDPLAQVKAKTFGDFLTSLQTNMSPTGLQKWLSDATNFATKFNGQFTPRPGFFGQANSPEQTECYINFDALKRTIDVILKHYDYKLQQPPANQLALKLAAP